MKKRFTLFLAFMFLLIGAALAQTKVTGTVVEAGTNEAVIGASVMVQGSKTGTVTDINGKFSITVPAGKKLTFSYVGMKSVTLSPKAQMKVIMESDATNLGDVVVTGMQKMDKRLFTGATSKVAADDVKLDGVPDASRALEGRVAGVSVQNVSGTFGTAPKIRVRGATSIYGSSKPLWVVDGVIMEDVVEVSSDQLSSGDAETLISSAIAGLNSDDIESFQILKDGSATSIYGARAMAGVIVVTTKKGKTGQSSINYTGEYTMRLRPSYSQFNIMNSQEQMSIYKEMYNGGWLPFNSYRNSSSGVYGKMYQLMKQYDESSGQFGLPNTDAAMNEYLKEAEYRNTDWFKELFSNTVQMNHSISLNSGTENAQYYTSFSIMNDPGWSKQSKVERYTMNINANYNISKKLTFNVIGNGSYRKQRAPGTNSSSTNSVTGEVSRDFDINPYSYALNTSRTLDPNTFYTRSYAPFNILYELENNYMDIDVVNLKFQGELKYKPIRKVELSLLASYMYDNTLRQRHITDKSNYAEAFRAMDDATMRDSNPWLYTDPDNANSLPISVLDEGGFYNEVKNKLNGWSLRATANYNDVYNEDHIVNFFGGMELTDYVRQSSAFDGVGMQYDMGYLANYNYLYFKQASEENNMYFGLNHGYSRDAAFFANANYSWKGRYAVNGTIRYEGSNRMGRSNKARWLPTWNVSASWNVHEEPFFKKIEKAMSHLSFRGSYSLTGDKPAVTNAQIMIYSRNIWRPFSSDKETALDVTSFANESLTYEKKHELNLGFDAGFLNNRINFVFDIFWRNNYDLIGPLRTTGVDGTSTKLANVANMKSSGQEFSLETKNIVSKDFHWTTDIIFSHVKTKVTKLDTTGSEIIDLVSGTGFTTEGYPYRSLFSFDFQGLNEKGYPQFINHEGEKTVTNINFQSDVLDYLIYEGPTDPTITGSLGNVFNYKNWRLNVFMTYSFGNVVRLDPSFSAAYSDLTATPKEFKNRWVVPGDEERTTIPVMLDRREYSSDSRLSYAYTAYNYSHERIAKGDFIRMKEISLSYDFPKTWLDPIKVKSLSMKLQATNLFLIYADKKLNGQDPEFFNTGGVAIPMPRQFTFTLKFGL